MYNDIKRRLIGPDPKSYDIGSDNGVKVISRVISPLEWKNQYPLIGKSSLSTPFSIDSSISKGSPTPIKYLGLSSGKN